MKPLALASLLLLYPLASHPSEQRVTNFGHGEAGAADYEHLSFWVRDGRRAEVFYAYGRKLIPFPAHSLPLRPAA